MNRSTIIERYYCLHRGELLGFLSNRLGAVDAVLAEDMVQDLFLRLLSDDRRLISEATLGSLVYTMAHHLLIDHYRRRAYQRAYESHALAVLPDDYRPEPAIFARDTVAHVEHRLQRLPQATADIYRLHLYDGLKTAEIAHHLHIDYKAVEYRLGQARREVRRLLRSG